MALDLSGLLQKDGLISKFMSRKLGVALGTVLLNHSSAPAGDIGIAAQALVDGLIGVVYLLMQGKIDHAEKALPHKLMDLDAKFDAAMVKALTKAGIKPPVSVE